MGNAAARALVNTLECIGFESTLATTAEKSLTIPNGAVMANCRVEGEPLRYRIDGNAPTAATGMEAFPRDEIQIDGQNDMAKFQFVRHGDSEPYGKIVCHYYK